MSKIRVGIDLGTTNTLACYMKGSKPEIIKFPGGSMLPSILYLEEEGTVLVGEKARKKGVYDPLNMIRSSKTEMGNFEKEWVLRGKTFSPTDVAVEILKEVKRGIIKKTRSEENTEIEAIITVPAYFTSNQIDETKKAGEKAGLIVLGIVSEPRAAAIANIRELGIEDKKIFVVDLGGGTFDISILEANKRQYNTLAVDGDRRLGGDNFDERIYDYIRNQIEDDLGMDLSSQQSSGLSYGEYYSMLGRIQDAAIEAKKELSDDSVHNVNLPNLFPYKNESYSLDMDISRDEFYSRCSDIFDKISDRIKKVFDDNENLEISDIDYVVLAGGSCYIPKIKEDVEDIFHISADTTMNRSTMVVVGACFIAESWDDVSGETDIISHSLGVETMRSDGKLVLSKLLLRGSVYPCEETHIFTTSSDDQESVNITIYEAGSDKEDVDEIEVTGENNELHTIHDLYGSFELTGIQKAKKGVPQIKVTFEYDRSRLLTVTAEDLGTGSKKRIVVTKGMRAKQSRVHIEPVDFVLLIDTSGSMRGRELEQAKYASIKLIKEMIDLDTHRLAVVGFGDKVSVMNSLSHNSNELVLSVDKLEAFGGTYMGNAIHTGKDILSKSRNKKVIMIVTDGSPNSKSHTSKAAEKAIKEGIDIITIAVGNGADKNYLSTLVNDKKYAFSIDNMEQLSTMFEKVVAQYLANID